MREAPNGQYRFVPGIAPYSSGVVASPGHEIVYATLRAPRPWRDGFALVEGHLRGLGRPRAALCAVALRSPAPLSFGGFADFNAGYRSLLQSWDVLVDGANPIARTNVVPLVGAPAEPSLHAFAYTVAGTTARPTFVVAGSGEIGDLDPGEAGIVRRGETSADAMRDKITFVMEAMTTRLRGLSASWSDVTAIDVYTVHAVEPLLVDLVLRPAGSAAIHGLRWFPSRPPIAGLEYEMDVRGVARELIL